MHPYGLAYTVPHRGYLEKDRKVPRRMATSGRWAILIIVVLALAAATFSWTYRRYSVRRSMAFWGPAASEAIARAQHVELLRLAPLGAESRAGQSESVAVPGGRRRVAARRDISHAPGLSHLRNALLRDASYAWQEAPRKEPIVWDYAVRFRGPGRMVDILFDLASKRAGRAASQQFVSIQPIGDGVKVFFEEQFARRRMPTE